MDVSDIALGDWGLNKHFLWNTRVHLTNMILTLISLGLLFFVCVPGVWQLFFLNYVHLIVEKVKKNVRNEELVLHNLAYSYMFIGAFRPLTGSP